MHVSATASVTTMLASMPTTNSAENATFTITITTSPPANTLSTSIPSSSYTTDGIFYSSAASGESARNRNIRTVVVIIISCIAGGLFLAAAVKYLACWARTVFHSHTQNQPIATDLEASLEEEVTVSESSIVTHSDKSEVPTSSSKGSATTTQTSKKRHGMIADTVQCSWLAIHDHHASNMSMKAKGLTVSPPCLSPLAPMSPFLVFDVLKHQKEKAVAEKQKHRDAAYMQLSGEAPAPVEDIVMADNEA